MWLALWRTTKQIMKTKNILYASTLLLALIWHGQLTAQQYQWAKKMGAIGGDMGNSTFVDHLGNVYVTGHFGYTVDFDPGPETHNLTAVEDTDVFFTKYDANGNYIFAKAFGGPSFDYGYGISTDASGNIYVVGTFYISADFDPGEEVYQLSAYIVDIFFAKYDSDGNFIYAKRIGASPVDVVFDMVIDDLGNLYLTGQYESTLDADPGPEVHNLYNSGLQDAFFAKYDPDGNYIYAHSISSISSERGCGIAIDSEGNAYITGYYSGTVDFDPSEETHELTAIGSSNIYFAKYDAEGNYVFAKSVGGTGADTGYNIYVDAEGDIYLSGAFSETADFDPGPETQNLTSVGNRDLFIAKYGSEGNYIYAKRIGGQLLDRCADMAVDAAGNVFITGWIEAAADFDPGVGIAQLIPWGVSDAFLAKYDSDGNYVYAKKIGGSDIDKGNGIALDGEGYIYLTGYFQYTADFDFGTGTQNLSSAGNADIYIAKYLDTAPTSTDEFMQQVMFSIYPNPASDRVTINSISEGTNMIEQVTITNASGQVVWQSLQTNQNASIDVLHFAEGLYMMTIKQGSTLIHQRFIICR